MPHELELEQRRSGPSGVGVGVAALALVVVTLAVFAGSIHAPFLFDDAAAITNNPTIRALTWDAFVPPADGSTTSGRPLVNVTLALNYAISGEHVWSYHVANILIHAFCGLLIFGIVRRTILAGGFLRGHVTTASLVAALLWAVHPLQSETVVCVAQRTESLCALFYLLTLYCFRRRVDAAPSSRAIVAAAGFPSGPVWLGMSCLACWLGMATKEVMVTAPLLVVLYDRTFVAGTFRDAWRRRRSYYVALATSWIVLSALLVGAGGSRGVAAGFGLGVSPLAYLATQCGAVVLYLKLAFWPHPLVLDYGTSVAAGIGDIWWQAIVTIALGAAGIWALVRRPIWGFFFAWFFLILAPSSSFVPLVTQTIAEHRMYLPLAAPIVVVVLGAYASLSRLPRPPLLLSGVAAAMAILSISRTHVYDDVTRIWADTAAKRPTSARAHNNLGWALLQQGRGAEAEPHFARAVQLDPNYVSARYNWGVALLGAKRPAEAVGQLEIAVRLAPGDADAQLNLGNALVQVGRTAEAISHFEAALRVHPAADAHFDLGVALAEVGRIDEAAVHFRAALAMDPSLADAHYQLGRMAERQGALDVARSEWTATLRLQPNHLSAHDQLGLLAARANDLGEAERHFRAILRVDPNNADAHANLGNVLLLQGQAAAAIKCYEEALRLRPNDARLLQSLELAREASR